MFTMSLFSDINTRDVGRIPSVSIREQRHGKMCFIAFIK